MAVSLKRAPEQFSLSKTSMASEEDFRIYCKTCDRDGPRLPVYGFCTDCSEYLCETCFKFHKRQTSSRHHTLLGKNSMPETLQQPSRSVPFRHPDDCTKPCLKHKKEMIKFYCKDHKALLCCECFTLEHTASTCKVNYIHDISQQIVNSKEYQDILNAMDTFADNCQKMSEDVKKMAARSNKSLEGVFVDIKTFRKEINQRLDELERQAEDAAKAIQEENDNNMKTVETTCDDVLKSLKTSSDSIKHLNTSKEADRLFVELNLAEQMIEDYENSVNKLLKYDIKEYNFKPNDKISSLIQTKNSLGTLVPSSRSAVGVKSRLATQQDDIHVRTSKDKDRCWITGMALLTPDLLVITDLGNYVIKLVDISSQSVIDQLQLDEWPQDVTAVSKSLIAVTLYNERRIQFISITSYKLEKKYIIEVKGNCYGISYQCGKIVVSFVSPAKIQVLGMKGNILLTVSEEDIFSKPLYVKTNNHSIYVSDSDTSKVTRLNWKGKVICSYDGMAELRGITLSHDESFFVCDWERNIIEEIADSCSAGKVVLKDLKHPFAICWCPQTSTLYVSSDVEPDRLQVFKLS